MFDVKTYSFYIATYIYIKHLTPLPDSAMVAINQLNVGVANVESVISHCIF